AGQEPADPHSTAGSPLSSSHDSVHALTHGFRTAIDWDPGFQDRQRWNERSSGFSGRSRFPDEGTVGPMGALALGRLKGRVWLVILNVGLGRVHDPQRRGTMATAVASDLTKQMYINGEWCDSGQGRTLAVINPADESIVAEVAHGTRADAERAIEAAA